MQLTRISPRKSLNKAYLKVKPLRSEIELFKTNLIKLLDGLDESESEEHVKNELSDFLKSTFFQKFYINTKGRNDLVIHNGPDAKSFAGVLIEAKKPSNKSEMIRPDNLNAKAFHELILYYLRERITNHNLEIKHLVATNIYEWYIFDAGLFEKVFAQNKTLVKQFTDFEEARLSGNTTDFFYKQIAEPFLAALTCEICFTAFDFREYDKPLRNDDKKDDSKLIALHKLLSPEHLLKLPFSNDSNSLDKAFYTELLHIIGLTETKEGSKKLIGRKKEGQRDPGSLIENAIIQIDSLDMISRIDKPSRFGETLQERLFNVSLELAITWINRILFMKLLEAQLINYHKSDSSYVFLTSEKINGYDSLNSLFFRVLARKNTERDPAVIKLFEKVPYLNSSLFEPTELERDTIFISNLQDDCLITILPGTVLKNNTGKRLTGNMNGLDYLFAFLDAYDFSGEGAEEIQEDNKTLINASVLGLIFEKINGYKDGSFFTPGFITMYMCHETIRRAVVQKFKDAKGWDCKDIDQVYDKIEDRSEANTIINSLKICDPAVGSGHFLVSALNEIIALKSDLNILQDREGRRLKEYRVEVVNDELMVTDEDGELFVYNPTIKESQRIQQTLFHEKQTIIENCLFGVDINPNSVKICRLRLWIELLKNSYYKQETNYSELETLPNIDINIKCGNSLISRYALDADLRQVLSGGRFSILSYRIAIMTYRNAENKEQKREMEQLIATIKSAFHLGIGSNDPRIKKRDQIMNQIFHKFTGNFLFEPETVYGDEKSKEKGVKEKQRLEEEVANLNRQIEDAKNNKIYENAFEWRYEFPEVLNDEGDFVGFDVVIGNPPYGVSIKGQYRYAISNQFGKVPDFEIYFYFIELGKIILKKDAKLDLIIPNTILFNVYAQEYRLSLLENWELTEILDCSSFIIFEDATVRNVIIQFKKKEESFFVGFKNTLNANTFLELCVRKSEEIPKQNLIDCNQNWGLAFKLSSNLISFTNKIKKNHILSEQFDVSQGYIPYRRSDLIKRFGIEKGNAIVDQRLWHSVVKITEEYKEELFGRNISKFSYSHSGSYVWYGKHLACYVDLRFFSSKRLMVREITNPTIIACLLEEEFVNDPQLISVIPKPNVNSVSLEFLWGLLNSKLATFLHFNSSPKATKGAFPKILIEDLKNFPIPESDPINEPIRTTIELIAEEIFAKKQVDSTIDTTGLEVEIDHLVYELYGLTEEEIKIVEGEK